MKAMNKKNGMPQVMTNMQSRTSLRFQQIHMLENFVYSEYTKEK